MKCSLSILIPTYNNACIELVQALHRQASTLQGINYEIIVADDGSTDQSTIEENQRINTSLAPHCRYIVRTRNAGRAAIRNFLAQEAQYEWLLFIDSDMVVRNDAYVSNYIHTLQAHASGKPQSRGKLAGVIYGGYTIAYADKLSLTHNLRYIFECRNKQNADHLLRQAHPYNDFHTSNFITKRDIMLNHPFDERFKHYGYEDVLWGKSLKENGISIQHVDNPLSFEHFETNKAFLDKTEEGLHTLYQFRDDLRGYSTLIDYAEKACRLPFTRWIVKKTFPFASLHIKSKLMGQSTSSTLFNIYKLIYFIRLGA